MDFSLAKLAGKGTGMENMACSAVGEPKWDELLIDIPLIVEPPLWPECCIYKVPEKLRLVNQEAYTPKVVSIGPFHYHLKESRGVKLQKLKYLKDFCFRTGKSQKDLASIIEKEEAKIRHYYSETFELINQKMFVNMILLDAIFIIELFWRNFECEKYDYILSNAWLESHVKQDLILLENQLPFEFLQNFYKSAFDEKEVTPFLELACQYFFSDHKHRIQPSMKNEVKHFTDLQRMFYRPKDQKPDSQTKDKEVNQLRYTATQLDEAGLEFKDLEPNFSERSLLGIEFSKDKCLESYPCLNLSWLFSCLPCLKSLRSKGLQCRLEIPQLVIDNETEALFRNLMALEQCQYPSDTYICNYVLLLDSLITTKADVRLLVDKKIILNKRGSSTAVTTLINQLGHQIVEPDSRYHNLYQQLNDHCDSLWNRLVASLTNVYFRDFWRGTATVAGILVLGFTFVNFLRPFVMKN